MRNEVAKELGGEEVRRQLMQAEVSRVRQEEGSAIAPTPAAAATGLQWVLTGPSTHRGLTLERVLRQFPDYFARLVQQTPAGQEPLANRGVLKENLQLAGVWDEVLKRAKELTIHDAHTTVAVEASGAMQSYHPDVRALHEIKLTRAREDQKNVGEAVVAVTSSPVAATTKSRTSRAKFASRARKNVKNCLLRGKHGKPGKPGKSGFLILKELKTENSMLVERNKKLEKELEEEQIDRRHAEMVANSCSEYIQARGNVLDISEESVQIVRLREKKCRINGADKGAEDREEPCAF